MIAKTEEYFNGLKEIGEICGAIRDELVSPQTWNYHKRTR